MKILIMSDIHGNAQALNAVIAKAETDYKIDACFLLGDLIDYGMHSNEVIEKIKMLPYPVFCNIRGNHEEAVIIDNYEAFSSERGKKSARYTRGALNKESWLYIKNKMLANGKFEFECAGKKCLAVHGSIRDQYWESINIEKDFMDYSEYDYVFSGHSHHPHFVEKYYPVDDIKRRNKKKVIFINPGSVGQPRNHNPRAQFVVLDMQTEAIVFDKVSYDISKEQAAYSGQVDEFYKMRLEVGV